MIPLEQNPCDQEQEKVRFITNVMSIGFRLGAVSSFSWCVNFNSTPSLQNLHLKGILQTLMYKMIDSLLNKFKYISMQ